MDCYAVLERSIQNETNARSFKDYIAIPKKNMYQSIHTTVIGPRTSGRDSTRGYLKCTKSLNTGLQLIWAIKKNKEKVTNDPLQKQLIGLKILIEPQNETKMPKTCANSVKERYLWR